MKRKYVAPKINSVVLERNLCVVVTSVPADRSPVGANRGGYDDYYYGDYFIE